MYDKEWWTFRTQKCVINVMSKCLITDQSTHNAILCQSKHNAQDVRHATICEITGNGLTSKQTIHSTISFTFNEEFVERHTVKTHSLIEGFLTGRHSTRFAPLVNKTVRWWIKVIQQVITETFTNTACDFITKLYLLPESLMYLLCRPAVTIIFLALSTKNFH